MPRLQAALLLTVEASLLLVLLVCQAAHTNAVSAGGNSNADITGHGDLALLGRRQLQQTTAPKRTPTKYSFSSSGDSFFIEASQSSNTGDSYSFLSVSGYNGVNSDLPSPRSYTWFSYWSCQTVELKPKQPTYQCSDIYGWSDTALSLSALDPKTMSATASATFSGTKTVYGSNPVPITITFSLTFPCNSADIIKSGTNSQCTSNTRTTSQPTYTFKSISKYGSTQCPITPTNIVGSILADGTDYLATYVKSPSTSVTVGTVISQDTTVSLSKTYI